MNPPSALHGAMSRDRKPFTYTPGGLDLSEIKSERMAKRLMRNAMNQGVPDTPVHHVQQQAPTSPVIVPNFNCLPVQVFPSFNLPANPKSLLRTRSIPSQSQEPPAPRLVQPSQFVNKTEPPVGEYDTYSRPMQQYTQINKNRPASMYEYSSTPNNPYYALPNYNIEYSSPTLPEISYDAQYFSTSVPKVTTVEKFETDTIVPTPEVPTLDDIKDDSPDTVIEVTRKSPLDIITDYNMTSNSPLEINTDNVQKPIEKPADDEREVKVVKKTVKKEQKSSEQNGEQNGDANIEAELTVKLPTKKSSGKTETKVEVVKKVLPDGSVEEVKTTTTKTTIDGRTEIKTKTETTIIPKDDEEEVEEVEEEEEEEQGNGEVVVEEVHDEKEEEVVEEPEIEKVEKKEIKENGQDDPIIKTEERSESTTTTTKRVVVVQSDEPAEEVEEEQVEEEEEEEVQEPEPVTVVVKKKTEKLETPPPQSDEEEEEEEQVVEEQEVKKEAKEELEVKKQEVEEHEEEKEEEVEEEEPVKKEAVKASQPEEDEEVEEEEEYEEAEEVEAQKDVKVNENVEKLEEKLEDKSPKEEPQTPIEDEAEKPSDVTESIRSEETVKEHIAEQKEVKEQEKVIIIERSDAEPQAESKVPLREPSIPLDKVEDIEIKPIGPPGVITKTHTEKTEIITRTSPQPPGVLSTQTEYNKVENIVTVNRTINTLDNTFEGIPPSVPDVKTYFAPNRDRVLASPMLSRPYQPVYPSEPTTERRHSLLLERLSVERQMPSEIYHNQTYEQQRQWSQEPQSEILTISNVKPSTINKQQWYQQRDTTYSNVTPTPPVAPTPSWSQPQPKPQAQPTYKPQPTYAPQQTYQPSPTPQIYQPSPGPQPTYHTTPAPQPTYQPSPTPQPQYQPPPTPQPQYQPAPAPQPQYQSSYSDTIQNNSSSNYSSYTPKPTIWPPPKFEQASTPTPQPAHYTSESYQKSTQQYSSSYVPPPWEQDSSYVPDNSSQNYYQPPPANTFAPAPAPAQSWKPPASKGKFSKPTPTSYIPPAPNQSFVKPVSSADIPRGLPGRKTYYSEYERRYISVPEANYVPPETKYQPQPDPSPQYYYDNNEPSETVEHQWRKELREFTEKTSQTQTQTEQTSVRPPWEVDPKYAKTPESTFTQAPTPTWSQTLRPRSWRERSFESEFVGSQEWPKTSTLGRGRPLSTYSKNESAFERTRGVSVDRYNPNNYQSPSSLEHPPVQTHTLNPNPAPHTGYHNPNVPAYHARVSAEPREQVSYKQPRAVVREPRASPFQSRSFKYLQWITGTDD
ncbi:titin isoform X1 [Manduca sexta]|uniref:titin isoform X1 n=1 Tax=Manduca sexta TaxID=7130 RepID=UPI00188E70BA|nr:titin isoform X1 [Manduca sexta]